MSEQILRSHLEDEVLRLHKERRNGLVLGLIMIVFVFGYMSWINSKWSYVTQPKNVAEFSAGVVLENLPSLRMGAEKMLVKQAPQLASYVGDTVTQEVPKLVAQMVETMVTRYSTDLSKYAVGKYGEAFKTIVASTKSDIAKAVATDSNDAQERAIVQAIEKQIQALGHRVDAGELGADPLFKQLQQSHLALVQLNARLKRVIAKDHRTASRKDKLTKRFLGTFWRFVQQENPDVVVKDGPKAGATAAGTTAAGGKAKKK